MSDNERLIRARIAELTKLLEQLEAEEERLRRLFDDHYEEPANHQAD